ncbi:MAG: UdgX family uracil-DNA binding protein [Nibricoccus sp.]
MRILAPRKGSSADDTVGHASPPDEYKPAPVPNSSSIATVRAAAQKCRACPLWRTGNCTVFGEGAASAELIFVGEQPGDQEDRACKPFVGPAGQLLDRALEAAGIDRNTAYVTNAVKHFKWKPQGKRRLHQKPNAREIAACRPWLVTEIELIQPELIVCLGATAAQAVVGKATKVLANRGRTLLTEFGIPALTTVHPSSLLRQPDRSRAEEDFETFVHDLKQIERLLKK